jgi:hypothetical protein
MPADPTAQNKPDPEPTPTDQESSVPEPPSPEAMEELSRQQGLITDEWTGDGPDSADEATEAGEGGRHRGGPAQASPGRLEGP